MIKQNHMNNCTRRTAMQQIIGLNACVEVKTEETPKHPDAEEGMIAGHGASAAKWCLPRMQQYVPFRRCEVPSFA